LQLALAVFCGENVKTLCCVVALAIADVRAGDAADANAKGAPSAIVRGIGAVVAEQIIAGSVRLNRAECLAEIA
jgi:hypothetical protein